MLRNILQDVDTNGDGQIDYNGRLFQLYSPIEDASCAQISLPLTCYLSEFRTFIDHTESGLWQMFQAIDRNHNGEIDKGELRSAFAQSGVTVSSAKLDNFFAEVDKNNDGVISYAEWRFVLTPALGHVLAWMKIPRRVRAK
jgi:solute carrier family 25 phosphate transporter 23/24/25/41